MATAEPLILPVTLDTKRINNRSRFWMAFRRNRVAVVGLILIALLGILAIFAPIVAPFDPIEQHIIDRLKPPSATYILGTDELGRDLFSRLVYGARISLVIGFVAQGVSMTIGITLGLISGWYGGWVDDLVMRITDVFFAIPGLLFLIVWVTIFEPGPFSIFLALGLIGWPGLARVMRGQVLSIKQLEYVTSAQALGASTRQILLRHILPNAIAPMIVLAALGVAGAILSEATLSFLGLGIQVPNPSWGTMVQFGKNYLPTGQWWLAVIPGLVIMLTVLGFNFLGDGLRDALDPNAYSK
jgi:ABC-type dipeptide/oligopeptide/nickel transport system permease subunit